MDIKILEQVEPRININYSDLKNELTNKLNEYNGLVVTEDTLSGCKAAQKELAGLRVKVDTYRKDKKRELEQPIKAFEDQCKELISLIENAEQPIKDGIKVFDDKKRDEKRQIAEQLIEAVVAEAELNDKYAEKLTVLDKYTNLTAKNKDVKDDLETRALALKLEQEREAERLTIINDVINSENERLTGKITLSMVQGLIDNEVATSEIIISLKKMAEQLYIAEHTPKEATVIEPQVIEPQGKKEDTEAKDMSQYKVCFEIVSDYGTLKAISEYLKSNNVNYKVTEQIKL